jgi:hypothetical protein
MGNNIIGRSVVVKKSFITLILLFLTTLPGFCSKTIKSGSVNYQEYGSNRQESILVLPMDENYFSTVRSSYSAIINTLGSDIVNTMNSKSTMRAMPLDEFNYKVRRNHLEPEIKRIMADYNAKGIIDYQSLGMVCNAIGAKQVIFITGDFNSFKFAIKPHPPKSLDIVEPAIIKPAYEVNTLIALIDPYMQEVLWQETYSKEFTVDAPQTDFVHNAISVKGLKRFSLTTANNVLLNVGMIINPPQAVTSVQSNIIQSNPSIRTKDGVVTKDGHSINAINKFVKPIQQKYNNWSQGDQGNL